MTPSPLELAVEALIAAKSKIHRLLCCGGFHGVDVGEANDTTELIASALAAIRQEGVSSYPVAEGAARSVDPTPAQISAALNAPVPGGAVCDYIDLPEDLAALGAYARNFGPRSAEALEWSGDIIRAIWAAMVTTPTDRAGPSATDYDPIPSDRLAAPGWRPDREQIAEAIRPSWDKMTEPGTTYFDDLVRTCADAILALKPPPPTDEMR